MGTPPERTCSPADFTSLALRDRLLLRSFLLRLIRSFFRERDFVEVETPSRVLSPGIDPYIDALPAGEGYYLATSPEMEMKKLLASGLDRIFQITRAYRAGERGDIHNPEFTILEWYAAGEEDYAAGMALTEKLVRASAAMVEDQGLKTPRLNWPHPFLRTSVDEAFGRHAGWKPSRAFRTGPFFEDLVNKVEPALAVERAVFLTDYPERVGSLARRKGTDPLLCERFELYLEGLEICNGFAELTDAEEQRHRFERDNEERRKLGKEPYPIDVDFLAALASGMAPCVGNALGVDRLLLALTGQRRLSEVTLLASERTFAAD